MDKGYRVKIVFLPDNVTDDVKQCLNQVGEITEYGSPNGEYRGYYVKFDDDSLPKGKRFYENELEVVQSQLPIRTCYSCGIDTRNGFQHIDDWYCSDYCYISLNGV